MSQILHDHANTLNTRTLTRRLTALRNWHQYQGFNDPTAHSAIRKTLVGGEFRGMSELEVEIWNECARFIALIIIYYNMHLLSKLYENALAKNDTAAIEY